MKKRTMLPFAMGAFATGITLSVMGQGWWWILIGVVAVFVCAGIEVRYEKEYVDISVQKLYRLRFPKGGRFVELVDTDFRLVAVQRQEHPHRPGYWTVSMTFEGQEYSKGDKL